jgi:3-oxoacyl-[acyl-carrier protein] reductase
VSEPRTVLVAGGAGGVGEGIVRSLLADGHTVFVPSRSRSKLDALARHVAGSGPGRLVPLIGNVGEVAGAAAVRDALAGTRLDVAIASLGGWFEGKTILELSVAEWNEVLNEMLGTHVVFAQTFLPVLRAQHGGRYIGIGGGAAYAPIPGSGPVCVAAAAQLMLTRVLRAEIEPEVDILELVVDGPVNTREYADRAQPDWILPDEVGAVVAELVASGTSRAPEVSVRGPIVRMRRPARAAVP